ncbi:hypothetical protein GY45DRAFT_1299389 [Cubamyces sp. BRFM 1775]|nr:hypothetical protein GY45DRAFT_1299389 [Cubamyces sp. BRFM 1775]
MPPKKRARTSIATPRRSSRVAADLAAKSRAGESSGASSARAGSDGVQCAPGLAQKAHDDAETPVDLIPPEPTISSDDIVSAFRPPREGILNMPLDILIEIFGLLAPRDLLALARTSKDFCSYLMSRRSMSCWISARHTVPGLPSCPSELSEPRYASLVFTRECCICGRRTEREVPTHWDLHVRYCPACVVGRLVAFKRPMKDLCEKIESMTSRNEPVLITVWSTSVGSVCCQIDEYNALATRWKALKKKEDKEHFAEEQMDLVSARRNFANGMYAWKIQEEKRKQAEAQALRERRYKQIVRMLKAEGWAEELARIEKRKDTILLLHKHVHVDRSLTHREWPLIRQSVAQVLEEYRATWCKEDWLRVLAQRLDVLFEVLITHENQIGARTPASDLQAQTADLCLFPIFRQAIYASMDTNITKGSFESLLDKVPALKAQWYAARKREFEQLVKKHISASGADPLDLAVASFQCIACGLSDARWPHLLSHRCAREQKNTNGSYETALLDMCESRGLPAPWAQTFMLSPNRLQFECTIIRAIGFEPNAATLQQMEECGVRFFCQICSTAAIGYQEVYTWKTAVGHTRPRCDTVFGPSSDAVVNKWCILDPWHAVMVRELEDAILQARVNSISSRKSTIFGCTRCQYSGHFSSMSSHCKKVHGIASPQEDVDYYVHLDSPKAALDGPITIYPTYAKTDRVAVKDVKAGRAFFSPTLFAC